MSCRWYRYRGWSLCSFASLRWLLRFEYVDKSSITLRMILHQNCGPDLFGKLISTYWGDNQWSRTKFYFPRDIHSIMGELLTSLPCISKRHCYHLPSAFLQNRRHLDLPSCILSVVRNSGGKSEMLAGSCPISKHKFARLPSQQRSYNSHTTSYLSESSHACSHLRAVVTSLIGRPWPASVAKLVTTMVAKECANSPWS